MADSRNPSRGSQRNSNISPKQNEGGSKHEFDILSREEEYKRLNAELEAKTASLVQEAEMVMKGQENTLAKSRLLDNINADDFLEELNDGYLNTRDKSNTNLDSRPQSKASISGGRRTESRPMSGSKKKTAKPKPSPNVGDDVAVPDDTFMTALQQQFSDLSTRLGEDGDGFLGDDFDDTTTAGDDVLPQAAADMGTEATIRFLKAKLRVMQEELDRLAHENHKKDEDNRSNSQKVKELEEEKGRLTRSNTAQQQQIDKHKKVAEEAKGKCDRLENELASLRKDLEQFKRSQKQQQTTQSATEVRLNRALEEIEKYREQLQRSKSTSKDTKDSDKRRIDQLQAENKRLEKQKNELMSGFKKQMKLIDVLKRQKMHVEAAKMMQFSEEEFVKALEWGS